MLLKDTRLWTGGKKAKKMPEIKKMPNQNLPAKWNKKKPDFWNLALKTPIWQPCLVVARQQLSQSCNSNNNS